MDAIARHGVCSAFHVQSQKPRPSRVPRWVVCAGLAAVLVGIAGIGIPGLLQASRASNERNASASLKTLATAEADFRANDRDENKIQDYWTGDVAGLWSIEVKGRSIALIDRAIAEADAAPLRPLVPKPVPKAGYFFAALRVDRSTGTPVPYQVDTDESGRKVRSTSIFGFCAYPARYGVTGRSTFIINENNTVFRLDTQGKPPTEWPRDEFWEGGSWKGKLD